MPRFSVVIPTRERAHLLQHCLKSCMSQKFPDIEFIVSDNFSIDDTKAVVENARSQDARIKYVNPGARLGMSEHWEFALAQANGDYVMVIGDDDALMPECAQRAEGFLGNGSEIDVLFSQFHAYFYPEIPDPGKANRIFTSTSVVSHIRQGVDTLMNYAAADRTYGQSPGIYYGFVHKRLVRKILDFGIRCLAPDVFIAFYLAARTNKVLFSEIPFALGGVSSSSNGFASLTVWGSKEKASLLQLESAIRPVSEISELSVPVDSSIHLLQIDCIAKLMEAGVYPPNLKVDWEKHVALAFGELKDRAGPNASALNEELQILAVKLRKKFKQIGAQQTASKPNEIIMHSYPPSLMEDGSGWHMSVGLDVRNAADAATVLFPRLNDLRIRNDRFLKDFISFIDKYYFCIPPVVLAFMCAQVTRDTGASLFRICESPDLAEQCPAMWNHSCDVKNKIAGTLLFFYQGQSEWEYALMSERLSLSIDGHDKLANRHRGLSRLSNSRVINNRYARRIIRVLLEMAS